MKGGTLIDRCLQIVALDDDFAGDLALGGVHQGLPGGERPEEETTSQ